MLLPWAIKSLVLGGLGLGLMGHWQFCQATELRLKATVYRGQTPVLVKDLFTIVDPDPLDPQNIGQLQVNWQLGEGWQRVKDILPAALADPRANIQVVGGDKIWLALCQPLAIAPLASAVKSQWQQHYAEQADWLVQTALQPMKGLKMPCIGLDQQVVASTISADNRLKPRLRSSHRLTDGSEIQLWWENQLSVLAPVASQRLSPSQPLAGAALVYQWVTPGYGELSQQQPPLTAANIGFYRATKAIAPGQVIDNHNSEKIPAIDKGENVLLVYEQQGIRIESRAKALFSGDLGEVIKVLADNASGPIKAVIVKAKQGPQGQLQRLGEDQTKGEVHAIH